MGSPNRDPGLKIKVVTTAIASTLLVVRLAFPQLQIDAVALGLLAFAVLPWLSPLIRSAELPGGLRIEFQEIKNAVEMVAGAARAPHTGTFAPPRSEEQAAGAAQQAPPAPAPGHPAHTFESIAQEDPNLSLVGLRFEIEKRLRALADAAGISTRQSLTQLTNDLQRHGLLEPRTAVGLRDLIRFGAQAAHGTPVAPEVAYAAVEYAPLVLSTLDAKLAAANR